MLSAHGCGITCTSAIFVRPVLVNMRWHDARYREGVFGMRPAGQAQDVLDLGWRMTPTSVVGWRARFTTRVGERYLAASDVSDVESVTRSGRARDTHPPRKTAYGRRRYPNFSSRNTNPIGYGTMECKFHVYNSFFFRNST